MTRRGLHQMVADGKNWSVELRGHLCGDLADILLSANCQLDRPQIYAELNKYGDRIEAVINAALELKHVIGEHVISSVLDIVFCKDGLAFDPRLMDDAEGHGGVASITTNAVVLCTTELGLSGEVKIVKGGQSMMDAALLLKPKVLLETR